MTSQQISKPEVSIIIPCYNAEAFLKNALRSISAQTFTNYEAVLVNDGSTDRSPEIASQFSATDDRIRVINSQNGGLAHARNLGLQHARGQFIAFLDSDDTWMPTFLQKALARLKESGADCFYAKTVDLKNNKYSPSKWPIIEGDLFRLLVSGNFIIISACVMKNRIFGELNLSFREGIYGHEDWQLFLEMSKNGSKFCGSKEVLAVKMWHSANMSYEEAMHKSGLLVKERADQMWAEFKVHALSFKEPAATMRYIKLTSQWILIGMPKSLKHVLYRMKVKFSVKFRALKDLILSK